MRKTCMFRGVQRVGLPTLVASTKASIAFLNGFGSYGRFDDKFQHRGFKGE